MGPKSLDLDLVESLAAASSLGHYYPPVETVDAVVAATKFLGRAELISQFNMQEEGFTAEWMEFQEWAYLPANGSVLVVVPPPDYAMDKLCEQMKQAVTMEHGAEVCCTVLPFEVIRDQLGALVRGGAVVGVSYEKCKWRLLRGGTRRKDYGVLVALTYGDDAANMLRNGLSESFWFAEQRSTIQGR